MFGGGSNNNPYGNLFSFGAGSSRDNRERENSGVGLFSPSATKRPNPGFNFNNGGLVGHTSGFSFGPSASTSSGGGFNFNPGSNRSSCDTGSLQGVTANTFGQGCGGKHSNATATSPFGIGGDNRMVFGFSATSSDGRTSSGIFSSSGPVSKGCSAKKPSYTKQSATGKKNSGKSASRKKSKTCPGSGKKSLTYYTDRSSSCKKRKTSRTEKTSSRKKKKANKYVDNDFNRRIGRVGMKRGTAVVTEVPVSSSSESDSEEEEDSSSDSYYSSSDSSDVETEVHVISIKRKR